MDKPNSVCKQKHKNQTRYTLGMYWKSCEIIVGDAIFMAGTVFEVKAGKVNFDFHPVQW